MTPCRARPDAAGNIALAPASTMWPSTMGGLITGALNLDSRKRVDRADVGHLKFTAPGWSAEWPGRPPDASGVHIGGGPAPNLSILSLSRERKVGAMRATSSTVRKGTGRRSCRSGPSVEERIQPRSRTLEGPLDWGLP
jgi:hypothetical protein